MTDRRGFNGTYDTNNVGIGGGTSDLTTLRIQFDEEGTAASVPVPAPVILLTLGVLALTRKMKRR